MQIIICLKRQSFFGFGTMGTHNTTYCFLKPKSQKIFVVKSVYLPTFPNSIKYDFFSILSKLLKTNQATSEQYKGGPHNIAEDSKKCFDQFQMWRCQVLLIEMSKNF